MVHHADHRRHRVVVATITTVRGPRRRVPTTSSSLAAIELVVDPDRVLTPSGSARCPPRAFCTALVSAPLPVALAPDAGDQDQSPGHQDQAEHGQQGRDSVVHDRLSVVARCVLTCATPDSFECPSERPLRPRSDLSGRWKETPSTGRRAHRLGFRMAPRPRPTAAGHEIRLHPPRLSRSELCQTQTGHLSVQNGLSVRMWPVQSARTPGCGDRHRPCVRRSPDRSPTACRVSVMSGSRRESSTGGSARQNGSPRLTEEQAGLPPGGITAE